MAHSRTTSGAHLEQLFDRLAVDRKKAVLAVCLILVMALMWFRVLTGRKPDAVGAAPAAQEPPPSTKARPVNVRFVELPSIPGRNDSIHRDFFAGREWAPIKQSSLGQNQVVTGEPNAVAFDHEHEVTVQLARKLNLEAITTSPDPQAFVNGQWRTTGDRLVVKEGSDTRRFELLRIDEESVLIGCNGAQLTLKLAQHFDVKQPSY